MASETVVVTGGCGFLGYHIVKQLREQHPGWQVHVISRNTNRNRVEGATYHSADVCSYRDIGIIFDVVLPTIVIHTASTPAMVGDHLSTSNHFKTNVEGTRCLLDCSYVVQSVKAFAYTSSVMVVDQYSHRMTSEDAPLKTESSRSDPYSISKALADNLVLRSNGRSWVSTACLRPATIYGEGEVQLMSSAIKAHQRGEHKTQIGNNTNLIDPVSASNCARAHVLAVEALLREREQRHVPDDKGVGGEAFFIAGGRPICFWDFYRMIWAAAGDKDASRDINVVSPWLIMALAALMEWLFWICTFGNRQPEVLRRDLLKYTHIDWAFSIDKARTRLGYEPTDDRDEQIKAGVRWYLENYGSAHGLPESEG